jgi:hypothetical protein
MRRYPRFINRQLRDEYLSCLASDHQLFNDWLSSKRYTQDHNGAFSKVKFEDRFRLTPLALEELKRLSALSLKKDVYLVCQCPVGQRCHREMLLLLAHKLFHADVEPIRNAYPVFQKRLSRKNPLLTLQTHD